MKSLVEFINESIIKEYQDKTNDYLTMKVIIEHMLSNLSPNFKLENAKNPKDLQHELFGNKSKVVDVYGTKGKEPLNDLTISEIMFNLIDSKDTFRYYEELNDNEDVFIMIDSDSNKDKISISLTFDCRWNWYNNKKY